MGRQAAGRLRLLVASAIMCLLRSEGSLCSRLSMHMRGVWEAWLVWLMFFGDTTEALVWIAPVYPFAKVSVSGYVGATKSLYVHFSVSVLRFFFGCWIGFLVSIFPRTRMFRKRSFSRFPSGLRSRRESWSSSGRTSSNGGSGSLFTL